MSKVLLLCVVAALLPVIQGRVKEHLGKRPFPMKGLHANQVTGRWYHQARFIPCSWAGSGQLTNMVRDLELGNKSYIAKTQWRVDQICTTMFDERTFTDNCAVQMTKDRIGDVYSGDTVFVATDYKRVLVTWGCMQYSQVNPNVCADPTLSIQTRSRYPTRKTKEIADAILGKIFRIKLADLEVMKHDDPCPI